MLEVSFTNRFKKNYDLMKKRGLDMSLLDGIIRQLAKEMPLAPKHRDHALTGDYEGFRECHITPDWLLVYYIADGCIVFAKTGSHSDLF